jgi:hypothetical protein
MDHQESTFLAGCAPFHDLCFFAKQLDELSARQVNNSTFVVLDGSAWTKYPNSVGWPAIAAATVKPAGLRRTLVFIGGDRDVWEVDTETLVETAGELSQARFQLASLAAINDIVFACGMGREVLRRDAPGAWRRVGPPLDDKEAGIIGFEDLAGFSLGEIYAVGWQGEVWLAEQTGWERLDSPVNANLSAVCCAPDGWVYAVGDGGCMLRGRGQEWTALDTGRQEALRDVCAFGNEIFVVSDFRILRLDRQTLAPDPRFAGGDRPGGCLRLMASADGVVSMGPKDVFVFRGGQWSRLA